MKTGVIVLIVILSLAFVVLTGYLLYKYLSHHPFHLPHDLTHTVTAVHPAAAVHQAASHVNAPHVSMPMGMGSISNLKAAASMSAGIMKQHASDAMHHLQMAHSMLRNLNAKM